MNGLTTNRRNRLAANKRKRVAAVSVLLGMLIAIGITVALGAMMYYLFQDQADLFASSSQIEIRNLNAVRAGDTLTITGNIKNVGSTSITNIKINEIISGDGFRIYDDVTNDCKLDFESGDDNDIEGIDPKIPTTTSTNKNSDCGDGSSDIEISGSHRTADITTVKGFSTGNSGASLDGGGSTAFQLKVRYDSAPNNIANTVQISDQLNFQLSFTSGNDKFVSDIYNTQVIPE